MTDKIGVLGEATAVTVTTTTVYTVPAGKAAKGKLMFLGLATASAPVLTMNINGINVMTKTLTASQYSWTTTALMLNQSATAPDGLAVATTVGQAPMEYYLAAGDTVTYTIGTNAMSAINVQFVGVEVDV